MSSHADDMKRGRLPELPLTDYLLGLQDERDALLAENDRLAHELADEADRADALLAENQKLSDELEVALQVVLQLQGELAGDAERDASGEPLFPPGCKCSSYGHGLVMTRVTSRTCPVHGEALAGDAE